MYRFVILVIGIYLMVCTSAESDSFEDEDEAHEVTRDECINAANFNVVKEHCCFITLEFYDEQTKHCQQIEENYTPTEDANLNYIHASIVMECIYKRRNFIKSDTQLNMDGVKSYAKSRYPDDYLQENFIVNMYTFCGQNATEDLNTMNSDEESKKLLYGTRRPYFTFLHFCTLLYAYNTECPFYIWQRSAQNPKLCESYATQCKKRYFKDTSISVRL